MKAEPTFAVPCLGLLRGGTCANLAIIPIGLFSRPKRLARTMAGEGWIVIKLAGPGSSNGPSGFICPECQVADRALDAMHAGKPRRAVHA